MIKNFLFIIKTGEMGKMVVYTVDATAAASFIHRGRVTSCWWIVRRRKKKRKICVLLFSNLTSEKEKKKTQHSTTEIPIHRIRRYGNQLKTIISHLSLYLYSPLNIVYQGTSLVLLRNNKMCLYMFFFSGGFYWVVHGSARRDQMSFF